MKGILIDKKIKKLTTEKKKLQESFRKTGWHLITDKKIKELQTLKNKIDLLKIKKINEQNKSLRKLNEFGLINTNLDKVQKIYKGIDARNVYYEKYYSKTFIPNFLLTTEQEKAERIEKAAITRARNKAEKKWFNSLSKKDQSIYLTKVQEIKKARAQIRAANARIAKAIKTIDRLRGKSKGYKEAISRQLEESDKLQKAKYQLPLPEGIADSLNEYINPYDRLIKWVEKRGTADLRPKVRDSLLKSQKFYKYMKAWDPTYKGTKSYLREKDKRPLSGEEQRALLKKGKKISWENY